MKSIYRVMMVGAVLLFVFDWMSTAVYGQHAGSCTCSQCAGGGAQGFSFKSPIEQQVFLDFDSGDAGNIDDTSQIRSDVVSQLETIYGAFGIEFVTSRPVDGSFTTLTFNEGRIGGEAETIDFRNLDRSDTATINIDGLGGGTSTAAVTALSANIAAHELGHLLGLRHRDAFGPIGSGVSPGSEERFNPIFTGPANAVEFTNHVISSRQFGLTLERFEDPIWLSERSAIKLSAITQLDLQAETTLNNNTIATAQALEFDELIVPNTIIEGENAGLGDFDVDAVALLGSITRVTDTDVFSFEGEAGDLLNFETVSDRTDRIIDSVNTELRILDSEGNELDYFGSPAFNINDAESANSVIFDLVLPESGTFFIEVSGSGRSTGDYELFFSRFNGSTGFAAVPEPASGMVLLAGLAGVSLARRRRR